MVVQYKDYKQFKTQTTIRYADDTNTTNKDDNAQGEKLAPLLAHPVDNGTKKQ